MIIKGTTSELLYLHAIYRDFTTELLKDNPDYWQKSNVGLKMPNYWIYTQRNRKVVEVMSYPRWLRIVSVYAMNGRRQAIAGEKFKLGSHMGHIEVVRNERNHANKMCDRAATAKQPKVWSEEHQKMVPERIIYFTDDDYCRIRWYRSGLVEGDTYYKFKPSGGNGPNKGFKKEMSAAQVADPLLKFKYRYHPYVKKT